MRNHLLLSVLLIYTSFISCNSDRHNSENTLAANDSKDILVSSEGKDPMHLLTDRPPNLETPQKYFLEDFTPNKVFFVRWHLSGLPRSIDPDTFRLRITGHVKKEISLSLADLKTKFKPFSIVALAECAGNSRSAFNPPVPGAPWKNGSMRNARWTGVTIKDIIEMAGLKPGAREISFNGMDSPPLPSVPDFVKSLKLDHAMDGEVMIAYEMNGEPLPLLNGYPLKLVVPGWYATYWIGMLNEVKVYADTFKGFWMDKAYLIPKNSVNGNESPDSLSKEMKPISKLDIRSIFVSPEDGKTIGAGKEVEIQGLAFDAGYGITKVEISADSGKTWAKAALDPEIGKYSWRRWRYRWTPATSGSFHFRVKATNSIGETQPEHQWNRSGYMKNEIEILDLIVKE